MVLAKYDIAKNWYLYWIAMITCTLILFYKQPVCTQRYSDLQRSTSKWCRNVTLSGLRTRIILILSFLHPNIGNSSTWPKAELFIKRNECIDHDLFPFASVLCCEFSLLIWDDEILIWNSCSGNEYWTTVNVASTNPWHYT